MSNILSVFNTIADARTATATERLAYRDAVAFFNGLELPRVIDPSVASQRVFAIEFDGTGNNYECRAAAVRCEQSSGRPQTSLGPGEPAPGRL